MKEVNNLLNRLGELDDAPLIWVNKKVYDMAEEIERLNGIIEIKTNRIQDLMSRLSKRQDRIDKAIEYIEENKRTYESNEYCFDDMIDDVIPLLDILKGVDKE